MSYFGTGDLPRDYHFRHGVGFVAHSMSKRKCKCRSLRAAQNGPVDALADLTRRVKQVPGLDHLSDVISQRFRSWRALGEISGYEFKELLESLPQMRVDFPEDFRDSSRFGPGHLSSIETLRSRARAEAVQMYPSRRQAAEYFKKLMKVRPIEKSRSWTRCL